MTKMKFETPDLTSENIEKIAALFPNCITEMLDEEHSTPEKKVYKRAVNFELLKQMLSPDVVDGDEAYEFTWVGKKAAIVEANKPIRKTLRPCVAESKDWDTTENLYIEGDNLEVLKLLQESYLGKVKMIYIDPPYNTGNDFIYADDFKMESEEWKVESGEWSEEGDRLFKNTDTNGRFHSDWCSMIYSRLMLARNLLTDSESHDYILCCAKNLNAAVCNGLPRNAEANDRYNNPDNDPRGPWTSGDLSVGPRVESKVYEIISPSGRTILPPSGYCWRLDQKTFEKYKMENRIWFGESGDNVPRIKRFLADVKQGITPMTIWKYSDVGHSQDATKRLKDLFDGKAYFDYPKPVALIMRALLLYSSKDSIILDFFSGSATTAHAVMQLNAEDGGRRKFIMVQLPEKCDEASEAYKAGYKNICEIGKERIRRAGEKILKEQLANNNSTLNSPNSKLDIGFRVLKLDSTNMKDVYYAPCDYDQDFLHQLESNIKDDRTDLDLLFGCLIEWGLPLSLPYKSEQLGGCTVHTYNDGDLIACFDANVPESVVKEIAQRKPLRAVFRDSGFASSPEKINMFEIFKLYMPEDAGDITKRVRVI